MKNLKNLILLLLVLLLFFASNCFMILRGFFPFEIPDVFLSFNSLLWPSILSLGILLVAFSLKSRSCEIFSSLLLWSVFYIMPIVVNYPNLGINIEQLVFAKHGVGNQGWPVAYILWALMRSLLALDDIIITLILGSTIVFLSVIFLAVLSTKIIKRPSCVYVTTLLFILPQTYYLKFFSDYSLAFPQLLLLLYSTMILVEKYSRIEHLLSAILLSFSLILTNPITSLTFFFFLMFFTFTQLVLKAGNVRRLLTLTLIYTILLVNWYLYCHIAFSAISPWINAIAQLNRLEEALSYSSYVRLARVAEISPYLQLLYYYRYTMLGLLGSLSLCSIYTLISAEDREKLMFFLSLLASSALPWVLLTASTLENFSSRFMLFGSIPISLMSGLVLLTLRLKTKKIFDVFLIVLSITLPVSYALSFSPSIFNIASHEFDSKAAHFIVKYLSKNYLIISDTWRINYIRFHDPNVLFANYIDSITVFNHEPIHVYLPQYPHAILLSLPQRVQTFASFGRPLSDWESLDKTLEEKYALIYNSQYSLSYLI